MRLFNIVVFSVVNVVCVIVVVDSLKCETTNAEGPKKNAACVFPFIYNGKTHNECTQLSDPDGKFW